MLSKEMYTVLRCFPRKFDTPTASEIGRSSESKVW